MSMNVKRYVAADMRTALRQVRLEQGPEAVIISSQNVPGGVEVCAAADFSAAAAAAVPVVNAAREQRRTAAASVPARRLQKRVPTQPTSKMPRNPVSAGQRRAVQWAMPNSS